MDVIDDDGSHVSSPPQPKKSPQAPYQTLLELVQVWTQSPPPAPPSLEPRLGCLFSFFLSADGKRWPAGARSRSHLSPLGVRSLLRVTHGFDGTNSIEQQRRRQTRRCPLRCNLLALMAGDEEALRCDRAEPRCRAHETPPKELDANAGGNVGNIGVPLGPHCRQQYGGTTRTQAVAYDTG